MKGTRVGGLAPQNMSSDPKEAAHLGLGPAMGKSQHRPLTVQAPKMKTA